jgi:hypothetical protein
MKYPDGSEIDPGDLLRIDGKYRGQVLSCIDSDRHLPGADGWGYLITGIMVDTDFAGLVHYTDETRDEFELIQRNAPPNWR